MRVTSSCGLVLILLFVFSLAGTSGCALLLVGGAGGAAGYAYAAGEHEKLYPYPVAATWAAVRESVVEMQLPIVSERADALRARMECQTATGEKVSIALEAKGEAVTEVGIRVGTFGDSTASRLLFEKIDARLPGPYPTEVAPAKPDVHVGVSVSQ